MAAIDLIVLGMLKQGPLSAYDIQKQVEYRKISQWVKISTPSIYKKVLQLEEKGLLQSRQVKAGNFPEKAVYDLTPQGEAAFVRLMRELSRKPIRMFLDCNAVVVNLDSLPPEERAACLADMAQGIQAVKAEMEENLAQKDGDPEVSALGLAVLRQQLALAQALEDWVGELRC